MDPVEGYKATKDEEVSLQDLDATLNYPRWLSQRKQSCLTLSSQESGVILKWRKGACPWALPLVAGHLTKWGKKKKKNRKLWLLLPMSTYASYVHKLITLHSMSQTKKKQSINAIIMLTIFNIYVLCNFQCNFPLIYFFPSC